MFRDLDKIALSSYFGRRGLRRRGGSRGNDPFGSNFHAGGLALPLMPQNGHSPALDSCCYLLVPACRATTAFASRIDRPSSPVRSKLSLATFAQSSFSAGVVALWVCLSALFAVHGI